MDEDEAYLAPRLAAINALIAQGRKLYLWGLGWLFWSMAALLDLEKARIAALVDRNAAAYENVRWRGRRIHGLDILKEAGPDDAVVLFSTVHAESMKTHLKHIGFSGQVIAL